MSLLVAVGALEGPQRPSLTYQERRNHFCDHCGEQVMTIKYDERTDIATIVPVNTEEEVLLDAFNRDAIPIHSTPPKLKRPALPSRPRAPSPSRQLERQSPTSSIESYSMPSLCFSQFTRTDISLPTTTSTMGSLYCADLVRPSRYRRISISTSTVAKPTIPEDNHSDRTSSQGSTNYFSLSSPTSIGQYLSKDESIQLSPGINQPDLMIFSTSSASSSEDHIEPCICSSPSSHSRDLEAENVIEDTDDGISDQMTVSISSATTDPVEKMLKKLTLESYASRRTIQRRRMQHPALSSHRSRLKRKLGVSWLLPPLDEPIEKALSSRVGEYLPSSERHLMN